MNISIEKTNIADLLIVISDSYRDERGEFREIYRKDQFNDLGIESDFVQLNFSRSRKHVVRGLHFQWDPPMGKLMRVVAGTAFLVAVDIRVGSPFFGKGFGITLSSDMGKAIWAPGGFARGLCALSDFAEIEYLCTGVYNAKCEAGIIWNDPSYEIDWPLAEPIVSEKDRNAQSLGEWLNREESKFFRYKKT